MARDQFGLQDPNVKEEFDFLTAGTEENPIVVEPEGQAPERQRDPETGRFLPAEQQPQAQESQFQVPPDGDAGPMVKEDNDAFGLPAAGELQAPEPQEQIPTGEQEQVEQLIFGKYKSMEEAEKGYKEIVALQTKTAQARRAAERKDSERAEYIERLEEQMRQALPLLQQANQPPTPQEPQLGNEWFGEGGGNLTPQQIQQLVDKQLSTRLDTLTQQAQQQAEQQRTMQEAETAVMGFYEKHPEVSFEGELDGQITETILSLNDAWARGGQDPLDISNPDSLEIAYEATKNPELRGVLELNPAYIDTDAGMQMARFQAAIVKGEVPITQSVVQGTTSQTPGTPAGGQRRPVTEKASVGAAPATSDKPLDEFEQAVLEFKKNRTAGLSGSAFS